LRAALSLGYWEHYNVSRRCGHRARAGASEKKTASIRFVFELVTRNSMQGIRL